MARLRAEHAVRALKMVWTAAPGLALLWFLLLVVQGAIPAGIVYTTKLVVDSANAALGGGLSAENIRPAAIWAAIMVVLVLLQRALGSVVGYIQTAHSEIVQDRIKAQIHEKAVEVDYAFYESDDYHNKLQHANSQASPRALSLLQNIGTILRDGVAFVSIATLLAVQYAWWLPLALLFGTLPALLVLVHHNRIYTEWWRTSMTRRRWAEYLDHMIIFPDYAAEVRLFGAGRPLAEMYQDTRKGLREEQLHYLRRQQVATFGATLLGLLTLGGVLVWVAVRAFMGLGTLGDLALFYQALNQGLSLMRSLIGGVGQIYANTLFLEDLFRFLDIEPAQRDPATPRPMPTRLTEGVTFENITFTYPGASRPSLRNLDLHLPNEKITAIVGANGAGKSTLVKLLCRLYEVQAGRILIDGHDVREFNRRELLDQISVLFQAPVKYQAPAKDNVRFADLSAGDDAVIEAARAAGAHEFIERLPKGYETKLGKMFYEGGELSGGQWQRVALARAYLRQSPIIALDEPTSAMDSWSEMEWFERFRKLVEGRTAVVITHRFTVAMQADIIHVMDDGEVVESGTHRDLLALGGRYASSWREQTRRAERAAGEPSSMPSALPASPTDAVFDDVPDASVGTS